MRKNFVCRLEKFWQT